MIRVKTHINISHKITNTQNKFKKTLPIGDAFLPNYSGRYISKLISDTQSGKSRDILVACLKRRQGKVIRSIVSDMGKAYSTIRDWLLRVVKRGLPDGLIDKKSTGRLPIIGLSVVKKIKKWINRESSDYGFESNLWSVRMMSHLLTRQFQGYNLRTIKRVPARLGFSYRKPRSIPCRSASQAIQEKFKKETAKIIGLASESRHKPVVFVEDEVAIQLGSSPGYGWLPRGEQGTVDVGSSTKSARFYGVLSKDDLYILPTDSINSATFKEFLEYILQKHKHAIMILDNYSPHKPVATMRFVKNTKGRLRLIYLPPRTPQLNPIEIQWRVLKNMLAGKYFNSEEEVADAVAKILETGQLKPVKLFDYIVPTSKKLGIAK